MRGKVAVFALSLQLGIFTFLLGKEKALKYSKLRFFFMVSGDSPGCPHHLAPGDCCLLWNFCCFLEYRQMRSPGRRQRSQPRVSVQPPPALDLSFRICHRRVF